MRGLVRYAAYLPFRRLDRTSIGSFLGTGGGRGTRAVASHDEDSTTLAVEALRLALRPDPPSQLGALWFTTTSPAYLDKTNAAAIHAALGLAGTVPANDFGGSLRSGSGALATALAGRGAIALALADLRDGLPGSADEAGGGDGAAAFLVADDSPEAPVLAEYLGGASLTEEFLDRWRTPGERRTRTWEERFGETRYLDLGITAWNRALEAAGLSVNDISCAAVTGMHSRAVSSVARKLAVAREALVDDLSGTIGQAGCAHPGLLLVSMLEAASPGDVLALLHLADGAEVFFFRATEALGSWRSARSVAAQLAVGAPLPYGKFLAWRGMLSPEPPRRPEPARVSSSAAWRSQRWKFGFTGSADLTDGAVHLPPSRVSMTTGSVDQMSPVSRADTQGDIATFTVDRLAYSPSPPIIFAVVDFDGGGRFPLELTDCDESDVAIGTRVEMTFRRLYSADGIHDYFWKARPLRDGDEARGLRNDEVRPLRKGEAR